MNRKPLARLVLVLAGAVAAVGLLATPAFAAGHVGKGFLGVTVAPVPEVFLAPGQAVHFAQATCGTAAHPLIPVGTVLPAGTVLVQPGDLTVDAVRAAFPGTVTVCTDVVLRSQVAADVAAA